VLDDLTEVVMGAYIGRSADDNPLRPKGKRIRLAFALPFLLLLNMRTSSMFVLLFSEMLADTLFVSCSYVASPVWNPAQPVLCLGLCVIFAGTGTTLPLEENIKIR